MATPVVIPHESVNDETVTLVSWLVGNGEWVNEGQAIASIETSKAIMEVNAPVAGFLQRLFEPGVDIPVGGVFSRIHGEAQDCTTEAPGMAPDDSNTTIGKSSTPQSFPAFRSADGNAVPQATSEQSALPHAQVGGPNKVSSNGRGSATTRFSRGATQLLKKRALDPELFVGRGLVRTKDILESLGEVTTADNISGTLSGLTDHLSCKSLRPTPALGVPVRTEKLSKRKQSEIASLSSAHHNTLVSSVSVMVPTRGLRSAAELHPEIKSNVTAVIIYEVSRLLRKFPHLNALYADGAIHAYEEVNIGVAVDGGRGLKVLVIRNTDTKTIAEIAEELQESVVRYLNDDVPTELLTGGTFTVTDLSSEGVFAFYPLLSQGQSAILGVGSEFFPPGGREGMFNLILSFDHQVSEGKQAAQFLAKLRDRVKHYEEALGANQERRGLEEPYCSKCLRPAGELQDWNHFLFVVLQSDGTTRNVCSICVQGV